MEQEFWMKNINSNSKPKLDGLDLQFSTANGPTAAYDLSPSSSEKTEVDSSLVFVEYEVNPKKATKKKEGRQDKEAKRIATQKKNKRRKGEFQCSECAKIFTFLHNLKRHINEVHNSCKRGSKSRISKRKGKTNYKKRVPKPKSDCQMEAISSPVSECEHSDAEPEVVSQTNLPRNEPENMMKPFQNEEDFQQWISKYQLQTPTANGKHHHEATRLPSFNELCLTLEYNSQPNVSSNPQNFDKTGEPQQCMFQPSNQHPWKSNLTFEMFSLQSQNFALNGCGPYENPWMNIKPGSVCL